jgi:hypothetical protein
LPRIVGVLLRWHNTLQRLLPPAMCARPSAAAAARVCPLALHCRCCEQMKTIELRPFALLGALAKMHGGSDDGETIATITKRKFVAVPVQVGQHVPGCVTITWRSVVHGTRHGAWLTQSPACAVARADAAGAGGPSARGERRRLCRARARSRMATRGAECCTRQWQRGKGLAAAATSCVLAPCSPLVCSPRAGHGCAGAGYHRAGAAPHGQRHGAGAHAQRHSEHHHRSSSGDGPSAAQRAGARNPHVPEHAGKAARRA